LEPLWVLSMHPIQIQIEMIKYDLGVVSWSDPVRPSVWSASTPLSDPSILLDSEAGCHVDHEGFDLNVIEQAYYIREGIQLTHDPTLYKDGAGVQGTNAIIQPWATQLIGNESVMQLIVDHSHFVYRYPIGGLAREQVCEHVSQRPELARLLSAEFKCGLDFCIDAFNPQRVEPIVHIEWDFDDYDEMVKASKEVKAVINEVDWDEVVPVILRYNNLARKNKVDAFEQADTRSQLFFGKKSYILRPTL
jgi:hypothetical protein